MKLSDYVFSFLQTKGCNTVFYLPGGGCMHLLDSLGTSEGVEAVALLHEQAVAVAAESYANTLGKPGVALVTSGPGGTNAVTGVLAAYLDSSPCFFLSGQVKTADLKSRYGVRSLGSQEADIASIVAPITKYAVMVTDKNSIRYHLERAWHEMTSGRRGPVWIDIPLDIQGAQIEPDVLEGYMPSAEEHAVDVTPIIIALNKAERPLLIVGNGLMACKEDFYELLEVLPIPSIPTWKAMDYVPSNHPQYVGRVGGMGDRPGNIAMQNADLILSLGSRLDFSVTGYDRVEWAPCAKKIVVEIDPAEIAKLEGVSNLIPVVADVREVIASLLSQRSEIKMRDLSVWRKRILDWKEKYPVLTQEKYITESGQLTIYAFADVLSRHLPESAFIAPCSAGTTAEIFFQAFSVKPNQTIRSNHGLGSMGFEIPNAIGMCLASGGCDTVCIAGDGGMQLNIQELAVIRGRNLPIKIFVVNNCGYASIRNMQNNHFRSRHVGCDDDSGLYLPETRKLAEAYDLAYLRADDRDSLERSVKSALTQPGPLICEVIVEIECQVSPRTVSQTMPDGTMRSSPLENQYPFLPDEEVAGNMLP